MRVVAAVLVLASLPSTVLAQSLGDVAARERARRASLATAQRLPVPPCADTAAVEARRRLLEAAGDRTIPEPLCGPPLLPKGLREQVCIVQTVDERGEVESASFTRQPSDAALAQLILEAARLRRYWPAHVDGKPLRTTSTQCFRRAPEALANP